MAEQTFPALRPTKAAFLAFALLSLVYVTNSLVNTGNLKILQEYYEGGFEDAADKKKDLENALKLADAIFEEELESYHPVLKQVKEATKNSTSMKGLSDAVTDFLVKKRKDHSDAVKLFKEEIEEIWNFVKEQEYGYVYL